MVTRPQPDIVAALGAAEESICEQGWDPTLDGIAKALRWVLEPGNLSAAAELHRVIATPVADRRRRWIAEGGNPEEWKS